MDPLSSARPVSTPALPRVLASGALLLASACASDPPSFEDVPPSDELYAEGLKELEGRRILFVPWVDTEGAIETFQAIIDNYPYSSYAVEAELRIADAYFDDERYEEALSYYRDFGDLHPQHEKVPYSLLRAALCHYEQVRSVERDQTATREALAFLNLLIQRYPYAPETREGETVLLELRRRLSRNMLETGDFYMRRGEHQAAAARYRRVLDEYPGLGLDAEALYKLGVCYENMMRQDEALRLYHVILENYRDTETAMLAAERIAAAN